MNFTNSKDQVLSTLVETFCKAAHLNHENHNSAYLRAQYEAEWQKQKNYYTRTDIK